MTSGRGARRRESCRPRVEKSSTQLALSLRSSAARPHPVAVAFCPHLLAGEGELLASWVLRLH